MGSYGPTAIAATADDGCEYSEYELYINTECYLGYGSATNKYHLGLRWTGLTIPAGATITSAVIRMYGVSYGDVGTVHGKIWGRQADSPGVFDDTDRPSTVTKTTASVDWDFSSVNTTWVQSPDLSDIVQELLDDYGGFSSDSIAFAILDDTSGTNIYQFFEDYSDAGTNQATLEITWSEGGTGPGGVDLLVTFT